MAAEESGVVVTCTDGWTDLELSIKEDDGRDWVVETSTAADWATSTELDWPAVVASEIVGVACELASVSLAAIVDDSMLVGRTVTGGKELVGPTGLVVSVVSVGSKIMVLDMMTVVTLPSVRV